MGSVFAGEEPDFSPPLCAPAAYCRQTLCQSRPTSGPRAEFVRASPCTTDAIGSWGSTDTSIGQINFGDGKASVVWLPEPGEVTLAKHLVLGAGEGPFGVGLDLRGEATAAWERVQEIALATSACERQDQDIGDTAEFVSRDQDIGDTVEFVSRAVFFDFCCIHGDVAYGEYCDALFDATAGMSLPATVDGLSRHAFAYAALLLLEFPTNGNNPPDRLGMLISRRPHDAAEHVRLEADADWYLVPKSVDARVGLEGFRLYFLAKYSHQLVPQSRPAYETFLERLFSCACLLVVPKQRTLNGHGFRYAALLCGEFDFEGARQAASGRRRRQAPRDVLRLLAPSTGLEAEVWTQSL